MPVDFYATSTHTLNVVAGDILTIHYTMYARTSMLNLGPGVIWGTFAPAPPPTGPGDQMAIAVPSDAAYDVIERTYDPRANAVSLTADQDSLVSITIGQPIS